MNREESSKEIISIGRRKFIKNAGNNGYSEVLLLNGGKSYLAGQFSQTDIDELRVRSDARREAAIRINSPVK